MKAVAFMNHFRCIVRLLLYIALMKNCSKNCEVWAYDSQLLIRAGRRHDWASGFACISKCDPPVDYFAAMSATDDYGPPRRRPTGGGATRNGRNFRTRAEFVHAARRFWEAWRAELAELDASAATSMFDEARCLNLVRDAQLVFDGRKNHMELDLHRMCTPMAMAAVRSTLYRIYHTDSTVEHDLVLITGRGAHSSNGEAKIRNLVENFLNQAFSNGCDHHPSFDVYGPSGFINNGALLVNVHELVQWKGLALTEMHSRLWGYLSPELTSR